MEAIQITIQVLDYKSGKWNPVRSKDGKQSVFSISEAKNYIKNRPHLTVRTFSDGHQLTERKRTVVKQYDD